MKRLVRPLAFSCLIAGLVFIWTAQTGQDEVVAQNEPAPAMHRVLYAGPLKATFWQSAGGHLTSRDAGRCVQPQHALHDRNHGFQRARM